MSEKKVVTVEEFIQNTLDRIPVELSNFKYTEENINQARNTLLSIDKLTRIELHKFFRKAEVDLQSSQDFIISISEMESAYNTTKDILENMDDSNPFAREQKRKWKVSFNEKINVTPSLSSDTNINKNDIDLNDINNLKKDADEYVALANLSLLIFKAMYQYSLETRGEMNITEITLEKLYKDRAHIEKSSNPNAKLTLSKYDKAIENIIHPSTELMARKLMNSKNNRAIINDFIGRKITDKKLISMSGLGDEIFKKFIEFFSEETHYENIYSFYDEELNEQDVVLAAKVFTYHVIRIAEKLSHSGDINGITFQLYVARIAELQHINHDTRTLDNGDQTDMSQFRIDMFKAYISMFKAYMCDENIKLLRSINAKKSVIAASTKKPAKKLPAGNVRTTN